ncbi:PREDICTED: gamma-aminobutyric acid receptor alpha-like isoform X1 [Dinoponera quadriceps]|uniref:Gamma-aminobutyric acid receptor alpha-like isoform X1 n=1 Tax=Dinoponera quadriceps TaxID=609295 RepID=A0A6P3XD21_DINQU|nr:PREDICTED: gamma-aminobutyric acid receptor alpha-like isoform X1 [Dinoponera quadriceps]XP_014476308.1 PREDICTED: gamma-aminobutyric acid receptor alpha-like isoform X1 [Dinoponera quadriceps]XP_014476309.1 PREDICTED: gamma-aminobutyric acid receptor alpha-like isoform X1 [Dinoponera quadriceps]XP_014476311.1 PREDICTED: gamma-aminobutyric acid receptor alpha-like isoform X1 [Dinoponera quadriceps]XP_014476312.1 PREDICTED: gamma-aminobutyric acid receptor alpha-like isoform X1 [Dinoponera qu
MMTSRRLSFFVVLVPLTVCKYRYHALEIRATTTNGFAPSSPSWGSTWTIGRVPRATVNDIVSRNITMVLENLLMNYENSQLPTHGKGVPTVVKTNILIRSMGPVSELDMDYSMDCYFRQSWRDSRLSFLGPIKSLSLSIKMLERIWRPDTYFYNGKHSYVHTITVPNKLLRISQDGDILYSMRLTIKAKCPMELRNFPMDRQSCPLIMGSYAYTSGQLVYEWQEGSSVNFVPGMALSQFDLMGSPYRNLTFVRREGEFSVLQVSFNLQRHTGYFLIQVYVPCVLIVVLSWVSFWIHREATSDRVGLGITTVLTLSTISLDSRTDLPKVRYATALDWFLLMSFGYCIATLLEFAGVHYFTKIGSGEIPLDDEEWEEWKGIGREEFEDTLRTMISCSPQTDHPEILDTSARRRGSLMCALYSDGITYERDSCRSITVAVSSKPSTMEQQTQTELILPLWRQFLYCLAGDDAFRRRRQREAANSYRKYGDRLSRHINSVSYIDRVARVVFPASFGLLNICYWVVYVTYQEEFKWQDPPIGSISH